MGEIQGWPGWEGTGDHGDLDWTPKWGGLVEPISGHCGAPLVRNKLLIVWCSQCPAYRSTYLSSPSRLPAFENLSMEQPLSCSLSLFFFSMHTFYWNILLFPYTPPNQTLMDQMVCMLLINSYPVCLPEKLIQVSVSELKLGLKVALVSSIYLLQCFPPPLSVSRSLSLLPDWTLLNKMMEYKRGWMDFLLKLECSFCPWAQICLHSLSQWRPGGLEERLVKARPWQSDCRSRPSSTCCSLLLF